MRLAALVLVLSGCCLWGGEFAVFASGARMHVDRHEAAAGKILLYVGEGFTELDANMVTGFEPDGVPAAPAAAKPAVEPGQAAGAKPAKAEQMRWWSSKTLSRHWTALRQSAQPAEP